VSLYAGRGTCQGCAGVRALGGACGLFLSAGWVGATARIFDPLDFYVKDRPPNLPLTLLVLFAGLWGMPLLFVVSGLGAW